MKYIVVIKCTFDKAPPDPSYVNMHGTKHWQSCWGGTLKPTGHVTPRCRLVNVRIKLKPKGKPDTLTGWKHNVFHPLTDLSWKSL